MQPQRLAIITCSYGPDAQRCRRLCRSIDMFVAPGFEHYLVVPRRDRDLFADLRSHRRHVVCTEEVVPGNFRRVPWVDKWWLDRRGWPVRGWIMQQITKLSANHVTDAELLLFADSDLQFIRPFKQQLLLQDGQLRLHRIPGAQSGGEHLRWHERAAELLGLPRQYQGSDYIGQLISWRRDNLGALQTHLEQTHGRPWYEPIARSLHFSEYILYGAFVEHLLPPEQAGHFFCADDLCHCCWFAAQAQQLGTGVAVSERALAVLLQSNLGLSAQQEDALLQGVQLDSGQAAVQGA